MEYVLIKPDSEEWNEMWEEVKNHPINDNIENPTLALNMGEAWQYMGSYKKNGIVISDFRHRCHPKTDNLYRFSYEHTSVADDNIVRKVKL